MSGGERVRRLSLVALLLASARVCLAVVGPIGLPLACVELPLLLIVLVSVLAGGWMVVVGWSWVLAPELWVVVVVRPEDGCALVLVGVVLRMRGGELVLLLVGVVVVVCLIGCEMVGCPGWGRPRRSSVDVVELIEQPARQERDGVVPGSVHRRQSREGSMVGAMYAFVCVDGSG